MFQDTEGASRPDVDAIEVRLRRITPKQVKAFADGEGLPVYAMPTREEAFGLITRVRELEAARPVRSDVMFQRLWTKYAALPNYDKAEWTAAFNELWWTVPSVGGALGDRPQ